MHEAEFIARIDCRFPYDDLDAGLRLADEACAISPNAAFAVVDELARLPRGVRALQANRLAVLEHIAHLLDHPLAALVLDCAGRLIRGDHVTVSEAIAMMRVIAAHPGQYAALSIVYFSCDDTAGEADREYERIREAWDAAGQPSQGRPPP